LFKPSTNHLVQTDCLEEMGKLYCGSLDGSLAFHFVILKSLQNILNYTALYFS